MLLFYCFTTVCRGVLWVVVNRSTALSFHKFLSGLREGGALRGIESLLLVLTMSEYVRTTVHRTCTGTSEMLCLSSSVFSIYNFWCVRLVPFWPKYCDVTNIFYVCWLLPLAPITEIRIDRQCLVSVLVGTLWFRAVSSLSFESFFRYATKGKCCLSCDSEVFCITVCHAAAKLCSRHAAWCFRGS